MSSEENKNTVRIIIGVKLEKPKTKTEEEKGKILIIG